jgi:hypothetical protein
MVFEEQMNLIQMKKSREESREKIMRYELAGRTLQTVRR